MEALGLNVSVGYTAILVVFASSVYFTALVVWRLFFSPTAGFPGSKLAAATGWYEFYFDYWLEGQYIYEIERMHKKYGEQQSDCILLGPWNFYLYHRSNHPSQS